MEILITEQIPDGWNVKLTNVVLDTIEDVFEFIDVIKRFKNKEGKSR